MSEIKLSIPTSFTRIKLTDVDVIHGQQLGQLQKNVIQNRMADIAEEIINLTFSENKDDKYGLQLSYLQGQLHILNMQVLESDAANNVIISNTTEDN